MDRVKKSMVACMLAIVLTILLSAEVVQAAGSTGAKWSIVPSPNVAKFNELLGVAAVSATDIWAVGHYDMVGSPDQILIEHWNGTSWQAFPNPNPGLNAILYGVAAVSATDVWAVGNSFHSNTPIQTLIEHWNGSSWQIVPSPNVAGNDNGLRSVAAVSANDVWAVGNYSGSFANQTLIEHWNGTSWQIVPSPSPGGGNQLEGVSAVSATDVWAVGYYATTTTALDQTLIEHWNGTNWQVVSSPNVGSLDNFLFGVAAVSASNAWAVGYSANGNGPDQTLIEHWNGSSWQVVSSPSPGSSFNQLTGVTAVSASNAWAVGYSQSSGPAQTLTEHWNGTTWKVISSPNIGLGGNQLNAAVAVTANDVWAVGTYNNTNGHYKTLIEHWN